MVRQVEQLKDLRCQWESNQSVVCHKYDQQDNRLLVVLQDEVSNYNCHRYFIAGFGADVRWEVSVDGTDCSPTKVLKWLNNPGVSTLK